MVTLRDYYCRIDVSPISYWSEYWSYINRYNIALNIPLVSTVPCIRNLRNTIHRFPKDKVRKGRMDCMRRWRIQGTVRSLPCVSHISPTPIIPMHGNEVASGFDRSWLNWSDSKLFMVYVQLLIDFTVYIQHYAVACSTATSARSLCSLAHTHSWLFIASKAANRGVISIYRSDFYL